MTKTGGKPSLPPEQAKRVREAMKELLRDPKFANNKTALGRAIGKSQSAVSQLIAGDNSASLETAEAVAALMKTNVWTLLGKAPERFVERVTVPTELQRVLDAEPHESGVRGNYIEEDVRAALRANLDTGASRTEAQWLRVMNLIINTRRRAEQMLAEDSVGATLSLPKTSEPITLHDDPTETSAPTETPAESPKRTKKPVKP